MSWSMNKSAVPFRAPVNRDGTIDEASGTQKVFLCIIVAKSIFIKKKKRAICKNICQLISLAPIYILVNTRYPIHTKILNNNFSYCCLVVYVGNFGKDLGFKTEVAVTRRDGIILGFHYFNKTTFSLKRPYSGKGK